MNLIASLHDVGRSLLPTDHSFLQGYSQQVTQYMDKSVAQKFHFAILRIEVTRASRGLSAIAELLFSRFALCYRTGLSVLSVTLMYCGQTVGWIKMPLDTEIGLGPGHIVTR